MKLLKLILMRSRSLAVAALLASIISGLLSTAIIYFAKHAVEHPGDRAGGVIPGFFLLGLMAVLSRIGSEGLLMNLLQESLYQMRRHLVESVLRTPLAELEKIGDPRITATLTSDVNTVSQAIVGLPLFMLNTTITAACFFFMLTISPLVAGVGVLLLPIGIAAHTAIARGTQARFRRSREREDDLFDRFGELTGGIKDLKLSSSRRDQFLNQGLEETMQEYKKYKIQGLYYFLTTISLMKLLFYAYLGLVLFVLPVYQLIPASAIVPAVFVILYGIGPFSSILHWLPNWGQARVSLEKIESLGLELNHADGGDESLTALPEPVLKEPFYRLELDQVTYRHRSAGENQFALGPIDLSLSSGSIVFVVGGNGSGKTTLAKIMMGLYQPAGGEIRVNGERVDLQSLRALYGAVFADLMLFAELPPRSDPELAHDLLADMGLARHVTVADNRFSNTRELSQGQRKRLAIVIALLQDQPIYLFDEWAADQDPSFRQRFYEKILPNLKRQSKLIIAISHDDRWFHIADHLVHMEYGSLRSMESAALTLQGDCS